MQATYDSVGASRSSGKGMSSIVIPIGSGILEGIENQSMGSDQVTIELPPNCYEDNDFLGFALCCVYAGTHYEYHKRIRFFCHLEIKGNNGTNYMDSCSFDSSCDCYKDEKDKVSDLVWVLYYLKVAIWEQYHSHHWTHLLAFFKGYGTLNAKECGIGLIYACCFKCQPNEECQRKLCLKGKAIDELPIIECPSELDSLC